MTEEERQDRIRALKAELAGYELRGLKDRCAQVEAELARLQGDTPAKRAERRPGRQGEKRA